MTTEAKPCPFCGGSDIGVFEGSTFRWMFAECRDCGAQAGEVRVQTIGSGTREEWKASGEARAIEEWNKRAEVTTPTAASGAAPALPSPDLWMDGESIKGYCQRPGPGPWFTADAVREFGAQQFNEGRQFESDRLAALAFRDASSAPLTNFKAFADEFAKAYGRYPTAADAWGARDHLAALASPQVAPAPETEICPHCDGSGEQSFMSDAGPDAYEKIGHCEHCNGNGTLAAAYAGVKALLERSLTSYREASAAIWYTRDDVAARRLRNIADYVIDPKMSPVWVRDRLNALADMALAAPVQVAPASTGKAKTWAAYVAGMIETYLGFGKPAEEREAAIAGIIERRLWVLPIAPAAADDARDAARREAFEEAVKVAEDRIQASYPGDDWRDGFNYGVRDVADRLRFLSTPAAKPADPAEEQGS